MRFTLIDSIVELQPSESICAVKNLSLAEEYLQDHFPGFPVMPGVLQVEALVQTSAWLMRYSEGFKFSTVLLDEAKAIKFNSFVKPGDTMRVESRVLKKNDETWTFKASAQVGETNTVSARLTLRQFNLAETDPPMQGDDQLEIDSLKRLFSLLYPAADSKAVG